MKTKLISILALSLIFISLQSQSDNHGDVTYDLVGVEFYNEFIPCVGGSDFNQENVDEIKRKEKPWVRLYKLMFTTK